MFVFSWWLAAWAGVPIVLPSDQRPADWVEVLRLGDLTWVTADPVVVVTADGPLWTVHVRDPDTGTREASIPAPSEPNAREDLVWLVVSLLTRVTSAEPPPERVVAAPIPRPTPRPVPTAAVPVPAPAPAPVPVVPEPAPVVPEPAPVVAMLPPEPAPKPVAPTPAPAARRPPAPVPTPRAPREPRPSPPDDPGLRPWIRLASGLGLRPGVAPSVSGVLSGGVVRDTVGVGLGVGLGNRTPLPSAGPDRDFAATPLFVEGLVASRLVLVGAQVGAEHRRFFDGPDVIAAGFMPFVRAEAALSLYLGSRVHLEPGVGFRRDIGGTAIQRDGVQVLRIPSSTFAVSVAIRYR